MISGTVTFMTFYNKNFKITLDFFSFFKVYLYIVSAGAHRTVLSKKIYKKFNIYFFLNIL